MFAINFANVHVADYWPLIAALYLLSPGTPAFHLLAAAFELICTVVDFVILNVAEIVAFFISIPIAFVVGYLNLETSIILYHLRHSARCCVCFARKCVNGIRYSVCAAGIACGRPSWIVSALCVTTSTDASPPSATTSMATSPPSATASSMSCASASRPSKHNTAHR
ncbi:hypothetical protein BD626DRAFT_73427 [Schizophyllum amplum]|uniref:Uncharacterized protein n=1 Tax=Schizophyllum amplum TaxID=97359 RepID=A0A550CAK7_9AGAR|nr:hypothetical protein BD626DRAFT_73427 [Auriculariopsis ampla]